MNVLVDANVVLRFVLDDHPDFSPRATSLFERAARGDVKLLIPSAILAECVYTLKSFYKLPRDEVSRGLLTVLALPGVAGVEDTAVREALRLYGERSVDFADALLAALSRARGDEIATFDRDLARLGASLLDV